jgi:hypothetical protein
VSRFSLGTGFLPVLGRRPSLAGLSRDTFAIGAAPTAIASF